MADTPADDLQELRDLVESARAGDILAQTQLVAAFTGRLIGFFRNRGASAEVAEERAQETWIRFFKSYDPSRGNPVSFLFTVAHSVWIDFLRRKKSRPGAPRKKDEDPAGPGTDVLDELIQAEEELLRSERLKECLERLDERQREIIKGRFGEGRKLADIAKLLGETPAAIRSVAHRAIRKLTDCMKAHESRES